MFSVFHRLLIPMLRSSRWHLLIISAFVVATLPVAVRPTTAAPAIGNGDCWRPGTAMLCRTVWQQGVYLHIYVIDNFSDQRPGWGPGLDHTVGTWTAAAGPQILRRERAVNDSWVFFEDSQNGQDGLNGQLAMTWNCSVSNYCTNLAEPFNIHYSSIKLNKSTLDRRSIGINKTTQAHELGHALGLFHSTDQNQLMYSQAVQENKGPTSADTGINPPCSGTYDQYGVRCIYNWSR